MRKELWNLLDCMQAPAAVVHGGTIEYVTAQAKQLGLEADTPLAKYAPEAALEDARELTLPELGLWAAVCPQGEDHVLLLQQPQETVDVQLLTGAGRVLRETLNEMAAAGTQLELLLEEQEDAQLQQLTARLNRCYYRLLRTTANLSQVEAICGEGGTVCRQRTELTGFFRDFIRHVEILVELAGRELESRWPTHYCYGNISESDVRRALLNLLSNAIRYSPPGSTIHVDMSCAGHMLRMNVQSEGLPDQGLNLNGVSQGYLQPPEPGEPPRGLGLGVSIARSVARLHGGVLLMQGTPKGGLSACLCLPMRSGTAEVRQPQMEIEPFGGLNTYLIELADVLPDAVFDSRGL